jgi:hypothetical protein
MADETGEVKALAVMVGLLKDMPHSTRRRVLRYLNDRFFGSPSGEASIPDEARTPTAEAPDAAG